MATGRELAPVRDVAVVPLGEGPDGLEVVGKHSDTRWGRVDRGLYPRMRLGVVVATGGRLGVGEPVQRDLGENLLAGHEAGPVAERVEQLAPRQLTDG